MLGPCILAMFSKVKCGCGLCRIFQASWAEGDFSPLRFDACNFAILSTARVGRSLLEDCLCMGALAASLG